MTCHILVLQKTKYDIYLTFVKFLLFISTWKFEYKYYNNENKKNKQILAPTSSISYHDAAMSKVEIPNWLVVCWSLKVIPKFLSS